LFKVLSFRLAGELFGIEINQVKEINRNVEYTAVPRAPDTIVGLFNMRGQIVTLFNLAKILGFDQPFEAGKVTCIILKSAPNNPNQQGFLIEATGDVIDLEEAMCEPPPANVDAVSCKYVKKVARLERELVMIIEPQAIFT
jgi:purine-binding chemotaxis protein CheW